MTVRTWVARFCVADGRVEEEGPWLGSLIRQRPDDEADELYVVVEPASEASAEHTPQLVDVIAGLYRQDLLSLTGALTRSLKGAHDRLVDWNRKSLKEHRIGAGATCLALRRGDAYLAQVGPSLAYVLTANGDFRRIEPGQRDFDHALGIAEEFEPKLTRVTLNPGDVLLVASTQLDDVVPAHHVERILTRGAEDALSELYLLCRDHEGMALLMLSCLEPAPEPPPDFLRSDDALALEPDVSEDMAEDAVATLVAAPPVVAGAERVRASVAAGASGGALSNQAINDEIREITQSTAPPPSAGIRLRSGSASPSYRRSTGSSPMPQFRIPMLAVFAVAALALLGLVAFLYLPQSMQESRESEFTGLVQQARELRAEAEVTSNRGLKRQHLQDAHAKLIEAEKIRADDIAVIALTGEVNAALVELDAVYEIPEFTQVVDLAQSVAGEFGIVDTAVGGGSAYMLDAKGKRVLRVRLDGTAPPETILEEGALAGFVSASRPQQIAWSDNTESLTIVDDQRQAFAYFPDRGTLPMTIRDSGGIGSIDAIAMTAGNLYVLDKTSGQVWRYLPGQGGFDSERTGLLDPVSLQDATELVVGKDVYVLDDQLGVRRFAGRTEEPFPLAGIDTSMLAPVSLSVLPGSNRLVVADHGNRRIIVADEDGNFLRQLVAGQFNDLRAVSVDEGHGIMYVLDGNKLLRAPFPP